LFPDYRHLHTPPTAGRRPTDGGYGGVVALGVTIAATFGIICTIQPYLALLVFVAVVGSVGYGVLALGAYGAGLASPIVLGGLAFTLLPARRAARVWEWLAARRETIHLAQGVLFAFLGGLIVTY